MPQEQNSLSTWSSKTSKLTDCLLFVNMTVPKGDTMPKRDTVPKGDTVGRFIHWEILCIS